MKTAKDTEQIKRLKKIKSGINKGSLATILTSTAAGIVTLAIESLTNIFPLQIALFVLTLAGITSMVVSNTIINHKLKQYFVVNNSVLENFGQANTQDLQHKNGLNNTIVRDYTKKTNYTTTKGIVEEEPENI